MSYVLSYIGQETLNGAAVFHVSGSQPLPAPSNLPSGISAQLANVGQHLSTMDVYLDPTTSVPIALAFNTHPDGNALIDIPVWIQFSRYQKTAGVQVPMRVQKFLNNGLVLDIQLTDATLNSGLSGSPFQLN